MSAAVSYTHLDVYKRQVDTLPVLNIPQLERPTSSNTWSTSNFPGKIKFQYNHLCLPGRTRSRYTVLKVPIKISRLGSTPLKTSSLYFHGVNGIRRILRWCHISFLPWETLAANACCLMRTSGIKIYKNVLKISRVVNWAYTGHS